MNFSLSIDKLFKYLEKISPVVITMSIVSGLMLFAPYSIKEKLFLTDISVRELRIISTIFLFSVSLTLLLLIESCICSAKKRTMVKKCKKHYLTLEKTAQDCLSCGHCDSRCPFGVAQQARMQEIAAYFA